MSELTWRTGYERFAVHANRLPKQISSKLLKEGYMIVKGTVVGYCCRAYEGRYEEFRIWLTWKSKTNSVQTTVVRKGVRPEVQCWFAGRA